MRDHLMGITDRRQVVGAIPFVEQRQIRVQSCHGTWLERKPKVGDTCAKRRGAGHEDNALTALPGIAKSTLQMHHQEGDRRRRHPGDTRCLADRLGAVGVELLLHLGRQASNRAVIEIVRKALRVLAGKSGDAFVLSVDVAGIFDGDFTWSATAASSTEAPAPGSVISAA